MCVRMCVLMGKVLESPGFTAVFVEMFSQGNVSSVLSQGYITAKRTHSACGFRNLGSPAHGAAQATPGGGLGSVLETTFKRDINKLLRPGSGGQDREESDYTWNRAIVPLKNRRYSCKQKKRG